MSEIKMRRRSRQVSITLTTATSTSTTLHLEDFAGGVVDLGTASASLTSLQMWGASSVDGTFRRVYGADGSAADITVAGSTSVGSVYALPDATFGVPYLQVLAGQAAGTGVAAVVTLKS